MTAAVEMRSVSVHAGARCVLDVAELSAAEGSVVALMGPNGAGKTRCCASVWAWRRPRAVR